MLKRVYLDNSERDDVNKNTKRVKIMKIKKYIRIFKLIIKKFFGPKSPYIY
jgi:SUMO ligase MMS21 Smc5/6 complex component